MLATVENIHGHSFRLDFDFLISEKRPLSGGAIFTIILFTFIFIAIGALALVLWLNKQGIIDIRIPKKLRPFCLKNFMTDKEKECVEHDEAVGTRIGQNTDLHKRLAI